MFRLSTYNLLRVSRAAASALYIERNSIHILARGMLGEYLIVPYNSQIGLIY
jgi:hypothetical protein